MLLAIDVGNTHTCFALCGEKIEAIWRVATDRHRTEDEYAATLLTLMHQRGIQSPHISGIILSSVVPDTVFPLRQYCLKYLQVEPLIVGKNLVPSCMKVEIDHPAELGADRLVNAYAAWERYKKPLIVIDFGTATTFDVVNAQGSYIGGAIAPGVNLSLEALKNAAAKLHGVSITRPEKVIGTNTTLAMQSGIYFGYLGLVEGIIARIRQEYGDNKMVVVATGGLAGLYGNGSKLIDAVDPELTMLGLQLMYQRHISK